MQLEFILDLYSYGVIAFERPSPSLHVEQPCSIFLAHIKLYLDQMTPVCVFPRKFINTFHLDFLDDTNMTEQEVKVTNISQSSVKDFWSSRAFFKD